MDVAGRRRIDKNEETFRPCRIFVATPAILRTDIDGRLVGQHPFVEDVVELTRVIAREEDIVPR